MKNIFLVLLGFNLLCFVPRDEVLQGTVNEVIDGNTIELLTGENEIYRIELYGIDCPESDQPYGEEARSFLAQMIKGKKVSAIVEGKNRWGIRQAIVIPKGKDDPRLLLLANGLAWAWEKNAPADLETIGRIAKSKGVGLWKDENPVPPWTYRRQQTMLTPKAR